MIPSHSLLLPRLRTGLLNNILIPLPPLEEQLRLVAYLDGLQAQVSALRAVQAETERELRPLRRADVDIVPLWDAVRVGSGV